MTEMQDNPYSAIINVLRSDVDERNVPSWRLGILRSLSPPTVELGGQLVSSGVMINSLLLGRKGRLITANLKGKQLLGSPKIENIIDGDLAGDYTVDAAVKPGDQVVVLQSSNGQEYVVLCKVG